MRRRRVAWGIAIGAAAIAIGLAVATALLLSHQNITSVIVRKIHDQLNLDATIDDAHVTWLPRPRVTGSGVRLRIPGQDESPPFVSVERFSADIGLLSAIRRHVETLHVDGLTINVPPGDVRLARRIDPPSTGALPFPRFSAIVVDRLMTHDAELTFIPRKPGDSPLRFQIHALEMTNVGFDRPWPFTVELTTPVPAGRVEARGVVGPWNANAPDDTPVSGTYVLRDADLSTINGMGGTLDSTGAFRGGLTSIRVTGQADVESFSLDLGGKPVTLTSTFTAIVDGTDGSTTLQEVQATILHTSLLATGAITNLPGPGRPDVAIEAHVADGRIEDLLAMVLDTPEPIMMGAVQADVQMTLPPGTARVRNRIRITGAFGLVSTTFTNANVRNKIEELSRRSRGKKEDDPLGRVLTDLSGRMNLSAGVVTLSGMRFEVPGATVALDGTYQLGSGEMDFRGTLAMEATVSRAAGGFKSIFIKPFDRLFKKDGAGAVLPIRISGTRDEPNYSVDFGRVFGRRGADDNSAPGRAPGRTPTLAK